MTYRLYQSIDCAITAQQLSSLPAPTLENAIRDAVTHFVASPPAGAPGRWRWFIDQATARLLGFFDSAVVCQITHTQIESALYLSAVTSLDSHDPFYREAAEAALGNEIEARRQVEEFSAREPLAPFDIEGLPERVKELAGESSALLDWLVQKIPVAAAQAQFNGVPTRQLLTSLPGPQAMDLPAVSYELEQAKLFIAGYRDDVLGDGFSGLPEFQRDAVPHFAQNLTTAQPFVDAIEHLSQRLRRLAPSWPPGDVGSIIEEAIIDAAFCSLQRLIRQVVDDHAVA